MALKALLLTGLLFIASHARSQSLLWQIDHDQLEQSSFLFGTIHVGTSSVISFDSTVMDKLRGCTAFAMELDPSSYQSTDLMLLMQMPDSVTVHQYLDSSEIAVVDSALHAIAGAEGPALKAFYPIVLSTFFAQTDLVQEAPLVSVDVYLQQRAQWMGIKVFSLEKLEEQAQALAAIPMAEQYEALLQAIQGNMLQEDLELLQNLYQKQQLDALYEYTLNTDHWNEGVDSVLLDQRNHQMLLRMQPLMETQATFTAVGAAHLAGEKGLLALLKQKGYQITPIKFEFTDEQH